MKAIILAGGVGSRISREVNKPKSLLDIGDGMPLLCYTVEMLQRKGIEVSIVLGYKKEPQGKIELHLGGCKQNNQTPEVQNELYTE